MTRKPKGDQVTPDWIYTGDEVGTGEYAARPRNLRGHNGRVKVTPHEDKRNYMILDIAGIAFEVPRMVAEELNAALSTALRPYAGLSIFERIMELLDSAVDRLQTGGEAEDGRDPGRAEAFCIALAMIRNTYQPDYEAEREAAMARWEALNPNPEE